MNTNVKQLNEKEAAKHPQQVWWDLYAENKKEITQQEKICNYLQQQNLLNLLVDKKDNGELILNGKYQGTFMSVWFGYIKTNAYGKPLYFQTLTKQEVEEYMKLGLDMNTIVKEQLATIEDVEDYLTEE